MSDRIASSRPGWQRGWSAFAIGAAVAGLLGALPVVAADWPQYRGPHRLGVNNETGLATSWEAGLEARWRRPLGSGYSGISVVGERLYTMDADAEREAVVCLDAATGATVWRYPVGEFVQAELGDGGPRSTPTVVGGVVYTVSSQSLLVALAAEDGALLWQRDLTEWGAPPRFGYAVSPLVVGDLVVVDIGGRPAPPPAAEDGADEGDAAADDAQADESGAADGADAGAESEAESESDTTGEAEGDTPDEAVEAASGEEDAEPVEIPPGVAAFRRSDGELVWTALSAPAGYTSPLLVEIDGTAQLIYARGTEIVALSPAGEPLWRHPEEQRMAIPMPLFLPPDLIFYASADDALGGRLLRVGRGEEGWSVEPVWDQRLMRNHFNSSVAVGGHLYGFDKGTLRCLDAATGERRWAKRGFGQGSLVASGERLYVLGDDGALALVEATPDEYRELGRVQATEGRAWTAPSLANGRIYVRDFDEIVSFDVTATAAGGEGAKAGAVAGGATSPEEDS